MPSGLPAASLRDAHALFSAGTAAGLDDDELLRRFAARRDVAAEVAFAALVTRHGPMVLAACRRALGDEHEAEDAFQATFLVLARRASTVRGATLGPWLYGVARRVAHRARAGARRRAGLGLDAMRLRLVPGPGEDAASAAERAELGAVVDEELARLSGRDRAPLVLCDLGGLTHEEAAERLGWPVGTVKSRQSRARGRLRERLARRGLAPAVAAGLWESAMSAKAAPSSRLVRSTVEGAQWFAVRGLAPPAGVVPAGVVASAELFLKGVAMTNLKLAGAAAALGVSAVLGVAVVRGQDKPALPAYAAPKVNEHEPFNEAPGSAYEPSNEAPGRAVDPLSAGQPDRMRSLEDKLDRLLRALERPGTMPNPATSPMMPPGMEVARTPAANANPPRAGVPNPNERPAMDPPQAPSKSLATRVSELERRLGMVEQKLEQLATRVEGSPVLPARHAEPSNLEPIPGPAVPATTPGVSTQ